MKDYHAKNERRVCKVRSGRKQGTSVMVWGARYLEDGGGRLGQPMSKSDLVDVTGARSTKMFCV